MAGKVFVSCGQSSVEERQIASALESYFRKAGFDPYVAIQTSSLNDVNHGIIKNLLWADFYVFVDFQREPILRRGVPSNPRGSVFTHQELAIAYVSKFEHALFFRQAGVALEGLGKYLLGNAVEFTHFRDLPELVAREVEKREDWRPEYSRNLVVSTLAAPNAPVIYAPEGRAELIWHLKVENRRNDIAAMNTLARLSSVKELRRGTKMYPDRRRLKWQHETTYDRTILPGDYDRFDAFAVPVDGPKHIFLHSALDIRPRQPVIQVPGEYQLHYEIFSAGFPRLDAYVSLRLGASGEVQAQLSS